MNELEEDIALVMKHLEEDNMLAIAKILPKSKYHVNFVLAIATYKACKKLIEENSTGATE